MRVSFQTPSYCFEADFDNNPAAQAIIESLPLDSKISLAKDKVYFKTELKVPADAARDIAGIGDVVYSPSEESICVYFSAVKLPSEAPVIKIAHAEINPVEIGHMKAGDPVRIMPMSTEEPQKETGLSEDNFPKNRKLTQAEIDALVQLILAKKKQGK